MSDVPGWWAALLLIGAAYRSWRLLAEDTILERPRYWLLNLPRTWKDGDKIPDFYREHWAIFLTCPWCLGFWLSLGWWGAWLLFPHATLIAATPLVISAAVGLIAKNLDKDE